MTEETTAELLARLDADYVKGSTNEWETLEGVRGYWAVIGPAETPNSGFPLWEYDARFIVAIHNAYPRLRAIIKEQEETIDGLWCDLDDAEEKKANAKTALTASQAREAALREAIHEHEEDCPLRVEQITDVDGMPIRFTYEQGIADVLRIRCMEHREVPQYNGNEAQGSECAACAVEPLREALEILADDEHDWSGINCHDVHDIARIALAAQPATALS